MSPCPTYTATESDYRVDYREVEPVSAPRRQDTLKNRKHARPKSFNGIHRRRSKRIAW